MILTYIAVLWANATALSLIVRYLFGDLFCFGFSYTVAGYTAYFGEVLLSVAMIALAAGMNAHIAKPIDIAIMTETLASVLKNN